MSAPAPLVGDDHAAPADVGSVPSQDEFVAAGLLVPGSPGWTERFNLLRVIAARGGTLDEMRTADRGGRLVQLAGELWQRTSGRYTLHQVAECRGLGNGRVERLRLACQLPDIAPEEPALHAGDVEVVDAYLAAAELFGDQAALELVRVLAACAARVADAVISVYTTSAGPRALVDDTSLVEVTTRAFHLRQALPSVFDTLLGHQLARLARPNVTGHAAGFETRSGAIGFVDLVGFTARTSAVSLDELAVLLARFEAAAADLVISEGGRVIKFLGDGVMFCADELDAACRIARGLSGTEDVAVCGARRTALAVGEMLVREGDCFGPVVNMAARAAQTCEPGDVVIAGPVLDPIAPEFALTPLPDVRLRGVPGVTELRRLTWNDHDPASPIVRESVGPSMPSSAPR